MGRETGRFLSRAVAAAMALLGAQAVTAGDAGLGGDSAAYREMQMRRLFEPTTRELQREREGRVYIYDGLTDRTVQRAMDQEYDRVQSMMFVRTLVTSEGGRPQRDESTGEVVTEDDGC